MMTVTRPILKRCPFRDEIDAGELRILFLGRTVELHELADAIEALVAEPISHEEFTDKVRDLVPSDARVSTKWTTGPWSIECTADA